MGLPAAVNVSVAEASLHVLEAAGLLVHLVLIVRRYSGPPFAFAAPAFSPPGIQCPCVLHGLANRDFAGPGGSKTGAWRLLH